MGGGVIKGGESEEVVMLPLGNGNLTHEINN